MCHGFNDRTIDINGDRILLRIKKNYKEKRIKKKKLQAPRRVGCLLFYVPMIADNNTASVTESNSFLESLRHYSMILCVNSTS